MPTDNYIFVFDQEIFWIIEDKKKSLRNENIARWTRIIEVFVRHRQVN